MSGETTLHTDAATVLDVTGLTVDFKAGSKKIRAISGVDMQLKRGEVLALLGESGSGKSVSLRAMMRLLPATAGIGGEIVIAGKNVLKLSASEIRNFRGRVVSMVFQDPGLAFDPVYKVGDQLVEAIRRHSSISVDEARARALALFERVRIPSPERRLKAYPHEMSGGMRQRAMIAVALASQPQVLFADEPTTALDATVQIQVLLLLRELQRELGLAVVFVTHDIGVAIEIADRVAVMYAGRIVETGSLGDVIRRPAHPYTQGLLLSRSEEAMQGGRFVAIPGSPPDMANPPPGCAFAPRCAKADDACTRQIPPQVDLGKGHFAACLKVAMQPAI